MLVGLAVDGGWPFIPVAAGVARPAEPPLPLVCRAIAHGYVGDRPVAKVTCSKVLNVKHVSRAIVIRGAT